VTAHVGRGMPRQSRVRAKLAVLVVWLLPCAACFGQRLETEEGLAIADLYARPGAYFPRRIRVVHCDLPIAEIRTGFEVPILVAARWEVHPGQSAEKVIPAFEVGETAYGGCAFLNPEGKDIDKEITDAMGKAARGPRRPRWTLIVGLAQGTAEPGPEAQEVLLRTLRGDGRVVFFSLSPQDLDLAARCGLLDAIISEAPPGAVGCAALFHPAAPDRLEMIAAPPPPGTGETVQPKAFELFSPSGTSAGDLRRLWLWLGVLALAALVAAALVPRRRPLLTAAALVALASAAALVIYCAGGVRLSRVLEARVFHAAGGVSRARLEHFILLDSRGGALARFTFDRSGRCPLPLPIVASDADLYRPACILRWEEGVIETQASALVHVLDAVEGPVFAKGSASGRPDLSALASRADVVAALRIDGGRATDADGRSQTLDAWAVEWAASGDPDVAYAGRSLKWWDSDRREGDGPFLLAWFHDPAPQKPPGIDEYERLPALVVFGEALKQP